MKTKLYTKEFIRKNYLWNQSLKTWVRNSRNAALPFVIVEWEESWFDPNSCEERLASVEQDLKDLQQKYQDDMNDLAKTAMGGTDPD